MGSELENAYVSLRWKLLTGEIPPGTPLSVDRIEEMYSIGIRRTRQLLNALVLDGYLRRVGNSYSAAVFTHEQVEEWRQLICAFAEIGAGRLVLGDVKRLMQLKSHVERTLLQLDVRDEHFYIAGLEVCALLLGGRSSPLLKIAVQLIPPVFFRLLWLADSQAGHDAFLMQGIARLFEVAQTGSVREAKAACLLYFDGAAPLLHAQLDEQFAGKGQGAFTEEANQIIEPRLTGLKNYIAPKPMQKRLLPDLCDAKRASMAIYHS